MCIRRGVYSEPKSFLNSSKNYNFYYLIFPNYLKVIEWDTFDISLISATMFPLLILINISIYLFKSRVVLQIQHFIITFQEFL